MEKFKKTHGYKLIYIYGIPYADHAGMLKIGETTLDSELSPESLPSNCKELNQAARVRIKASLGTASVTYELKHTELALYVKEGRLSSFSDKAVHRVLLNSGVKRGKPNGETGVEWFKTNLDVAKNAIKAVKEHRQVLTGAEFTETKTPIDFREEQLDAIKRTLKAFKSHDEMLWYAKMRFGKTLTALEVVRQLQYRKVIIATHRPVVNDGWGDDFTKIFFKGNTKNDYEYFRKIAETDRFDEMSDSSNDKHLRTLVNARKHFIYFTSIQDLRGSQRVGGKFNKNNAVFDIDWDLIIIDEAHEGTQTSLGDEVIKTLRKKGTKLLSLSGTPFNLLDQYTEATTFTWDYVMEQRRKLEWDLTHHGDHNPYADLPQMHIYTYDLSAKLKAYVTDEFGTKAFNFKEFFRVHVNGARIGRFVHESDVKAFLNLLVQNRADSEYPFATKEYREMFRHTLWMVPGVKEAKALSELLREHPVFGSEDFGIANVAGEGDDYEETHAKDALDLVRDTIKKNRYSITLSCGKLTTGVTVPEWTAAFMLSGSYSTAASQYLQTIFRVQSAGCIEGKQKTDCYVFDFAPDRTLKVLSETVHLSRKPGKSDVKRRQAMADFLNFCPVISIAGSTMKAYSVNSMMEQLKQIYAERAIESGFDDESIYNDELLKLNHLDAEKFNQLKDIIGASKAAQKKDSVVVNDKGFTQAELDKATQEEAKDAGVDPPSPEELERRRKLKEAREARKKAIDILRGISIRMPLLIYGVDVELDEEIDIDKFVELVDDRSWAEFMPTGVTKEIFFDFAKYYDRDVFIAAAKRIRCLTAEADCGSPTVRVQKLAEIFSKFKNPDKETVLTPWRVVNLHLSNTIGGWSFFKDDKEDAPHFVEQGDATKKIFRKQGKVLEINSKTGLYPLYVAYSFYRQRLGDKLEEKFESEALAAFWDEALRENVYVICKTPMAKSITARTLRGYRQVKVNAHCFDDLINLLKHKPEHFKKKVLSGLYWKREEKVMKFDAVVGNPPYQEEIAKQKSATNGQARSKSVFHYFQMASDEISSGTVSLIYPGARWMHRAGKGMAEFGLAQINDVTLEKLDFYPNSQEIFSEVAIADGISIVYKNKNKTQRGFKYTYHKDGSAVSVDLDNPGEDLITLNPYDGSVVQKVGKFVEENSLKYIHDRVLSQKLFGVESSFVEDNPKRVRLYECDNKVDFQKEVKLFANDKAGKAGRTKWFVVDRAAIPCCKELIDEWQVVVSSANAGGQKRDNQIEIIDNHSAFGRSRVALGSFKTKSEAVNFYNYAKSKLIRFMFLMTDESLTSLAKKVPDILDYTSQNKFIDFSKDIDDQLNKLIGLTSAEAEYIASVIAVKDKRGE